MKKHLFYLTIMVAGFAFATQVTNAQGVTLRNEITEEGLKRSDHIQQSSMRAIFSQAAPSVGINESQLLSLYDSGVITL
jgi:hypothetical protein